MHGFSAQDKCWPPRSCCMLSHTHIRILSAPTAHPSSEDDSRKGWVMQKGALDAIRCAGTRRPLECSGWTQGNMFVFLGMLSLPSAE